ncbi:beta-ketoacyl-[acyl-carrier-protein] synthase family protein [Paenibacillus sp. PR3]|uniref:Beta-ketoacyl-[acyl-carrier-protein] synthase family protein n=1 Tax=Paenibacillus terricola TaxID=2763503 RepID=A0ABR8N221_9BACL|nr:beta-ketoacyl-[acyl-carrier-protein] synthase family protein [Paenibacillus terricola]MBD3922203.1 beta-ketoacyl-[acyl-carrier-protein] synthase family protein [Paenibacillus terricola]
MKTRVVVTGVGAVTPVGNNMKATWANLLEGKSSINKIDLFDTSHYDTKIAAQVKNFRLDEEIEKKVKKYTHRSSRFGIQAFCEAVQDAALSDSDHHSEEIGLAMGCGVVYPNLDQFHELFQNFLSVQVKENIYISPNEVMKRNLTTGISLMAELINAKGPMISLTTACASSAQAIGEAFRRIQCNEASVMITGGYDSMINYIDLIGFDQDGFVIGEGAAVVVLENLESAIKRRARIYGEIVGYSSTINAYWLTDAPSDGEACITAMKNAMNDGGLTPERIDYIAVHGADASYNDFSETNAIKAVLGEYSHHVSIGSTKSMIGNLTSAAGAINFITTLLAMEDNKSIRAALSNAFAFGGIHTCIAVKEFFNR